MNTVTGLRPFDTAALAGAGVGAPVAPAPATPGATHWLDGLEATAGAAPLGADVSPDARGLGPAEHAQRVLAALLGDAPA